MNIEDDLDLVLDEDTPELEENDVSFANIFADEDSETEDGLPIGFSEEEHFENLVDILDDETLAEICDDVKNACEEDKNSRGEWESTISEGIEKLGLQLEELDEPFPGACSVYHPIVIENSVKFQSKFTNELLPAKGPAQTQILGVPDDNKENIARRVKNHLNYQLTKKMQEYVPNTERMALYLPMLGCGFKKKAYDPIEDRVTDEFVRPEYLIIDSMAPDLRSAERYTHIIHLSKREVNRRIASGLYKNYEPKPAPPEFNEITVAINEAVGLFSDSSLSECSTILEHYCYLDIEDEEFELPYVVSIDYNTNTVISVRRNWWPNDESRKRIENVTQYTFIPGFGVYGLGYIHVLGNAQLCLTAIVRGLVDSGQFANLQGGFKLKGGARIGMGDNPIEPGEFREVETNADDIRKAVMPLPFKEPSATLFNMLQFLEGRFQKFADTTEQIVADSTNYGPVGTTLALIEQGQKFYSAIHKRGYASQEHELKVISLYNYHFLPDNEFINIPGATLEINRSDYDPETIDVVPVADPNIASVTEKVSRAQAKISMAVQAPHLHDMRELYRDFYLALDTDTNKVDAYLPKKDETVRREPLDDILAMVQGKPIKAYPGQNHVAHIQIKTAWLQDPANGASQPMQAFQPALMANVQEHQFLKYKEEVLANTGGTEDDFAVAQAAQRLQRLNQIAQEEEEKGSPEMLFAKAEWLRAQVDQQKENRQSDESKFKLGLEALNTAEKFLEENRKAQESGAKLDSETQRLGIDSLKVAAELLQMEKDKSEKPEKKDPKE